jgi:hypothetical protein
MLHCQACMCKGGRARHERDWETGGWACTNCGHVKSRRAPKRRATDQYILHDATSDEGLSRKNRLRFHADNPNGLLAKMKAVQARVHDVQKQTGVPNGVLWVHGEFNRHPRERLHKASRKVSPQRFEAAHAIGQVELAIDAAEKWIDETLEKATGGTG